MIPVAQDTQANIADTTLQLKATESQYDRDWPFCTFKALNTRTKYRKRDVKRIPPIINSKPPTNRVGGFSLRYSHSLGEAATAIFFLNAERKEIHWHLLPFFSSYLRSKAYISPQRVSLGWPGWRCLLLLSSVLVCRRRITQPSWASW